MPTSRWSLGVPFIGINIAETLFFTSPFLTVQRSKIHKNNGAISLFQQFHPRRLILFNGDLHGLLGLFQQHVGFAAGGNDIGIVIFVPGINGGDQLPAAVRGSVPRLGAALKSAEEPSLA